VVNSKLVYRCEDVDSILVSLLDFSVAGGRPSVPQPSAENEAAVKLPPSSQRCVRLAVVREVTSGSLYRRGDREVCSVRAGDGGRERAVYLSESNELEVVIARRRGVDISDDDGDREIFLLRYDGTSRH